MVLHVTGTGLNFQKEKLLTSKIYYDEQTGLMDESIAKALFEIEKNLVMIQILKLGINQLPLFYERPKLGGAIFSDKAKSILRLFESIEENTEELKCSAKLEKFEPDEAFWSMLVTSNELKVKTLSFFVKGTGLAFLRQQHEKWKMSISSPE